MNEIISNIIKWWPVAAASAGVLVLYYIVVIYITRKPSLPVNNVMKEESGKELVHVDEEVEKDGLLALIQESEIEQYMPNSEGDIGNTLEDYKAVENISDTELELDLLHLNKLGRMLKKEPLTKKEIDELLKRGERFK